MFGHPGACLDQAFALIGAYPEKRMELVDPPESDEQGTLL